MIKYDNLTIIDKEELANLKKISKNPFIDCGSLEIKDVENIDVYLDSFIKLLKDAHLQLQQKKIKAITQEENLQLIGGMNVLFELAKGLEQDKVTELRNEIYKKEKEKLDKSKKSN